MSIEEINLFLTSSELNNFLLPFKILAVFCAVAFLYGANKYYKMEELGIGEWIRKFNHFFHMSSPAEAKTFPERFQAIVDLVNKKNQIDTKAAILKTEFLLLDILKSLKLTEEMLEDVSDDQLPNSKAIKDLIELADKVRRDPAYSVNIERVRELFILMRDTLIKLKII